jgi:hypothetical protein
MEWVKWIGSKLFRPKIQTSYVSAADLFLQEFDHQNPKHSESQRCEVEKHRNIFYREKKDRVRW